MKSPVTKVRKEPLQRVKKNAARKPEGKEESLPVSWTPGPKKNFWRKGSDDEKGFWLFWESEGWIDRYECRKFLIKCQIPKVKESFAIKNEWRLYPLSYRGGKKH